MSERLPAICGWELLGKHHLEEPLPEGTLLECPLSTECAAVAAIRGEKVVIENAECLLVLQAIEYLNRQRE